MRRFLLATVLLLIACGGTGVREVRSGGGEKVYEAKCKTTASECIADARSTCSEGYEVLDSESHAGGVLADTLPGPVTWYSMTFRCSGFASSSRPDFPFRGQAYQEPRFETNEPAPQRETTAPARASSNPAPTRSLRSDEAPRGRECSSDFDCGTGNVCAKPAGSFTGECARAVNSMGTPTYQAPRPNLGPGERQCHWAMECGIGFECDQGRCMKR